nr:hypothetical protein [uncultured Brevundimonas sp.]
MVLPPREVERLERHPAPSLGFVVIPKRTARANHWSETCRVLGETHPGLRF